jgi:hypothetical protein
MLARIAIFAATLFTAQSSIAQRVENPTTLLHPYFGTGLYIGNGPGIGGEAGVRYSPFYMGLEVGVEAGSFPGGINPANSRILPYLPDDEPNNVTFYGIHAGLMTSRDPGGFCIGLVLMSSHQKILHYFWTTSPSYSSTLQSNSWINIGPEIRFDPSRHFSMGFAFTYHAGFKLGFDYVIWRTESAGLTSPAQNAP